MKGNKEHIERLENELEDAKECLRDKDYRISKIERRHEFLKMCGGAVLIVFVLGAFIVSTFVVMDNAMHGVVDMNEDDMPTKINDGWLLCAIIIVFVMLIAAVWSVLYFVFEVLL